MIRKLPLLSFVLAFSTIGYAADLDIARHLNPISISDLVDRIVSPADSTLPWSIAADDSKSVMWISKGVEASDSGNCDSATACRRGIARVSVSGKELHNLEETLVPVLWTIEVSSFNPEKFGPELVSLQPRCDTVACAFAPLDDFRKSGFKIEKICETRQTQQTKTGYRLSKNGRSAYVSIDAGFGSGGESDSMSVFLKALERPTAMCNGRPS